MQASAFQVRLQREAETKEREKAAAAKAAQAKRTVSEEDYSQLVEVRGLGWTRAREMVDHCAPALALSQPQSR